MFRKRNREAAGRHRIAILTPASCVRGPPLELPALLSGAKLSCTLSWSRAGSEYWQQALGASMRIPRWSSGLIISLLLIAAVMAAAPAKTQAPAPPVLGKEAAAIQQNGAKIGQIAKQYVPPAATQAVLTLTPITQTAQPNQSVHFELKWNRPVYRVSYHFEWGDGKMNEVTELSADHSYDSPQTYTVRVTATPLANVKMAMMMKPVAILSNAVSVAVVLPEQQTLTLDSDKSSINVGDTVTLTATLNPPAPDAQYQFNFDDVDAEFRDNEPGCPPLQRGENLLSDSDGVNQRWAAVGDEPCCRDQSDDSTCGNPAAGSEIDGETRDQRQRDCRGKRYGCGVPRSAPKKNELRIRLGRWFRAGDSGSQGRCGSSLRYGGAA